MTSVLPVWLLVVTGAFVIFGVAGFLWCQMRSVQLESTLTSEGLAVSCPQYGTRFCEEVCCLDDCSAAADRSATAVSEKLKER